MRSSYSAYGKYVVYIKSSKEKLRAKALLTKGLNGRCRVIDEYIETSVRKNYKPELEKAVAKCNEKGAKLLIPNIGHLPRSLAFCNGVMKLDSKEPYILAIRDSDHRVDIFQYYVMQMFLQCIDTNEMYKTKAKQGIALKKATGWKAGNPVNLDQATINASKIRIEQADTYCKEIIPIIREIQRYGAVTLQQIANALMARNIKTRRGKDIWTPIGVSNLLNKAKKLSV